MTNREMRTFPLEFRIEPETKKIVGHAAVFNKIDGPEWFRERIAPGAFADSLKSDDVRALFNHDPNYVLGRNKADTLFIEEDEVGLRMEIDPPDTQFANDLLVSIARGDISQASFAFTTIDASWDDVDGQEVRTLKKVRLYDVSPVTYPFYEATDVSLRKAQWEKDKEKEKQATGQPVRTTQVRRLRLAMREHA
jgi:HK97 family phage prohead protease